MDTLDNTEWDVLIVGTGLQQSLLALALSRSGKKILHVDENDYYGGAEAAFSLQEADEWLQRMNEGVASPSRDNVAFSNVTITQSTPTTQHAPSTTLSFSRAYSLALGPQLIYARSRLIRYLVSSRVYRQLDFLAVGSWWVYSTDANNDNLMTSNGSTRQAKLVKVPNGREDVFQDHDLDFKAKRALMKFLRFISDYEEQEETWLNFRQQSFPTFLSEQFKVPPVLQAPLLALALSPSPSHQTTTEYALPRVARHLRSIGIFGAGFGAVVPKWGGMAEINQVACRACAVGGGVYVLGKGLATPANQSAKTRENGTCLLLKDGEAITAKWVVGGDASSPTTEACCKSISIVSSSLTHLFPPMAEEAPAPASAVVVFPSGSLRLDSYTEELPPVYIKVHSSDTGECPTGQCVLYASIALSGMEGFEVLKQATSILLTMVDVSPPPSVLWSAQYQQWPSSGSHFLPADGNDQILRFPPCPLDLAFDDAILDQVKEIWQKITGNENDEEFLVFQDREVYDDDE